jgi:hypothetical protein
MLWEPFVGNKTFTVSDCQLCNFRRATFIVHSFEYRFVIKPFNRENFNPRTKKLFSTDACARLVKEHTPSCPLITQEINTCP